MQSFLFLLDRSEQNHMYSSLTINFYPQTRLSNLRSLRSPYLIGNLNFVAFVMLLTAAIIPPSHFLKVMVSWRYVASSFDQIALSSRAYPGF